MELPVDTRVSRSQGGYFLWFELPKRVDSLAPGPIFSAQQGFRNGIRLNCGHPWDARSEVAMARLGELQAAV